MRDLKNWIIWLLLTPILSGILWLVFTNHSFISYINTLFYISLIIFIIIFLILLVQEGIFDTTSYGFRRIRYQLSSRAKKKTMEHDEFFNPQHAKKETYFVSTWVGPALMSNVVYFIFTIMISLAL
ncbi:DUF3899 domain-containing protein [Staphylococcus pragensis]|uniref:DUF3899 domain-containing protein n=1 Tax=Staphylococcus pragensis TaxID=1611836 RepID=A0A4Z1BXU6_9STAP|nr:DUF3899 domain-containing protein [Staphylococcus pragensis]RTX90768.1 DUF3899 domain-containing protein [Staphylococcus carnosus]TGN28342.1 DUF3899 domain-containing protein [Staphylococcus pragensis]GGG88308.1 membrane protein [Staphylococcus pragensis]